MALLFLVMLMLAMTGHSAANWCVCRSDVSDSALQKALDYACGAGADCTPITQNGACYQPNTVRAHCSYAVNSYFQKKGQGQGSCEFSGAATVTGSDPSSGSCAYPASSSSTGGTTGGTSTTPSTTSPPSTTTPSTTTPPSMFSPPGSTTSPSTTNPSILTPPGGSGGVLGGGIGTGLGPSGVGINSDTSAAASSLERVCRLSLKLTPLWFSGLALLWA